jgi:hypothetical protein
MIDIKEWITQLTMTNGLDFNYETLIAVTWPHLYVEDKHRLSSEPGQLANSKIKKLGTSLQREIRKIQKAANATDLYVAVVLSRHDHYKFLIAASNEEELEIIRAGFLVNDRFALVE